MSLRVPHIHSWAHPKEYVGLEVSVATLVGNRGRAVEVSSHQLREWVTILESCVFSGCGVALWEVCGTKLGPCRGPRHSWFGGCHTSRCAALQTRRMSWKWRARHLECSASIHRLSHH